MKQRFEIETLESFPTAQFKIRDNDWSGEYVTDQNGNDIFIDWRDYTDVPSHIPKYVTVYEISRCYGGAEEGGWWFDNYEAVESVRVRGCSVEETKAFVEKNWSRELNRKHNRDSVLGREDYILVVELNKGEREQPFPTYE